MAEAGAGFLEQLKSCIVWSWTYLWTVWFFLVLFLVYILRVPLRINDNLSTGQARPGPARPGSARPPLPRPGKVSAKSRGGVAAGGDARSGTRRLRWPPQPRGLRESHPHPRARSVPFRPRGSPPSPGSSRVSPALERPNRAEEAGPAPGCAARAHAWLGPRARASGERALSRRVSLWCGRGGHVRRSL